MEKSYDLVGLLKKIFVLQLFEKEIFRHTWGKRNKENFFFVSSVDLTVKKIFFLMKSKAFIVLKLLRLI